mgnify:CR=1 FL=1
MSLESRVLSLTTAVGTKLKEMRVLVTGSSTGTLASLQTSDKTSIIGAINEARTTGGTAASPASETVAGLVEMATLAEVATGADTTRAVTAAGVRQERLALKIEILGGAAAAQDTLAELKTYVDTLDSADEGQIGAITTALANRVRTDTAAQGLDSTQQANARTNIDVYSKAEIGNPETDFVATLNTALA